MTTAVLQFPGTEVTTEEEIFNSHLSIRGSLLTTDMTSAITKKEQNLS